jgi:hypothetical protein
MLNIGAVATSAYAIGEAILRARKGLEVAKYGTQIRADLQKAIDEYTVRYHLSYREIEARYKLQRREIDAQYAKTYRESIREQTLKYRELEAAHKGRYTEQVMSFKNERRRAVLAGSQAIMAELMAERDYWFKLGQFTFDYHTKSIVAKRDELADQLSYDEQDAKWYLEAFQYGANVMGAIGGGTALPANKRPSAAVSGLAGALSGAASGAAVGSAFPGYGTVIGAGVGAIVGGLGGALSAR